MPSEEDGNQDQRDGLGVECSVEDCDGRIVGLEDGWEFSRGYVCQECIDYHDDHGHWPDAAEPERTGCRACHREDGGVVHECEESVADAVYLQPGDTCEYCEVTV